MKRLGSSDSLGALITVCPEEKSSVGNLVYNRGFQSMLDGLDEEDCVEESGQITEKKRRLSVTQVKALEKNFEVENKLEPERKVKLAQELGLQPRQVAVWFQNRRARWKTKQLERDYGILKANYEELKLNFDALQHDKESLLTELRELKSKPIQEENTESNNISIKEEEVLISESEEKAAEQSKITFATDPNHDCYNNGSSDSDSSAILNEGNNSPNAEILQEENHILISPACCYSSSSPSSMNCFSFSDSSKATAMAVNTQKGYQHQFVRMEEHNFFSAEEPCNFFPEDQAPTLQWYCSDQWS